jgi:hypothetical protein
LTAMNCPEALDADLALVRNIKARKLEMRQYVASVQTVDCRKSAYPALTVEGRWRGTGPEAVNDVLGAGIAAHQCFGGCPKRATG